MSQQITITIPPGVAEHAKVLIPAFTQYPNWRTIAMVGVPVAIGVGTYHWLYKGKSLIQSTMTAGFRFCQLSTFSVAVFWLAKREPIELPIEAIKEAISTQFPGPSS